VSDQGTPALPHLTAEFFVWLWYASERDGGTMSLGEAGVCDVWVEERLSFRIPDEDKARAVLTGENTAHAPEARAAMASGKIVRDLQMHLRREEREYTVTLRGVNLDLAGVKFPAHSPEGVDELLYERMYLYEDLWFVIGQLYRKFARERTADDWVTGTLTDIRRWVGGEEPTPREPLQEPAYGGEE
jgi:hypothetical protein